jgi:hypothetical protein
MTLRLTLRPFQLLTATALVALGSAIMAPAAMAKPHQPQRHAITCQQMVQSGSVSFPRVAVGCGTNPNGPRGYVSSAALYDFIRKGGRGIVISESQEVFPNQWGPHSISIPGNQMSDAKGNNVLIIP